MIFYLLCFLITYSIHAREVNPRGKIEQIKHGNFALPTSQQIGPLLSFGQNIVDKGDLLLFFSGAHLGGFRKNFTAITPNIVYGFGDNFSLSIGLPIAARMKKNESKSHGVSDLQIQFEYAVYSKDTETTGGMVTFVTNITAPTGSIFKDPETGFGAPTFFLGFTASHQAVTWNIFTSLGAIMPLKNEIERFGDEIFYQAGIGKNVGYVSEKWICDLLLECNGIYKKNDILLRRADLRGTTTPTHRILLCPSIFFSTERIILQAGVGVFVWQDLGIIQNKSNYIATLNAAWKF